MTKIYTPSQWYSLFQCPSIIIEDDGMIYKDEDYYKSFRQAIGKIDYAQGKIFGEDYYRLSAQPIGIIKNEGAITKIYGPDYYRLSAQPILYIRDNRIYAADEFYKTFPSEAAFISGAFGRSTTSSSKASDSSYSGSETIHYEGATSDDEGGPISKFIGKIWDLGFWGLIGVVFLGVVLIFAVVFPFQVLSGQEGADMAQMMIMGLGFGGLVAFFTAKDWAEMVIRTILFSILGIFALDVSSAYQRNDLKMMELILAAVFGVFLYGLMVLVPGIILGSILWFIKRPFIKKKETDSDEG